MTDTSITNEALSVGLVRGICKMVYAYGDKGFGNDG
jgi:hypothetical protein